MKMRNHRCFAVDGPVAWMHDGLAVLVTLSSFALAGFGNS